MLRDLPFSVNTLISGLPRPRRRLSELVCSVARCPSDKYTSVWADATREWHLRFLLSPVEALCNPDSSSVQAVKFAVNRLEVCAVFLPGLFQFGEKYVDSLLIFSIGIIAGLFKVQ